MSCQHPFESPLLKCKNFQWRKNSSVLWVWSDPFCQEDPLESHNFDNLLKGNALIEHATGKPLACTAWLKEFA